MLANDIASTQKLLKLSGSIQRDIINILSELSGFSKRRTLLEAQLRKLGHSPSGIDQSIGKLLSIGLLTEKSSNVGSRIALTKEIWSESSNIVEAIFKVGQILGQDRPSSTKSSTVIREVKNQLADRLGDVKSGKLYFGVVNSALLATPDWTLTETIVVRSNFNTIFDHKEKKALSIPIALKPQVEKVAETKVVFLPEGIGFLSFDVSLIAKNLTDQLSVLGMSISSTENHCCVSAKLPLGRQQKVYLGVRLDPLKRRIFWLFTVCGKLSRSSDFLEQILLENNNDCGPARVTVLKIAGEVFLGCCATVSADSGWEKELPQVVCLLSNLGDQLEEKFWKNDQF